MGYIIFPHLSITGCGDHAGLAEATQGQSVPQRRREGHAHQTDWVDDKPDQLLVHERPSQNTTQVGPAVQIAPKNRPLLGSDNQSLVKNVVSFLENGSIKFLLG